MLHHHIVDDGTPILILRGVTLDHHHVMETLEPVSQTLSGGQCNYVDLPGHGLGLARDSTGSQDDLLFAVIDIADTILPDQRFAIIGELRGSYLAKGNFISTLTHHQRGIDRSRQQSLC